MRGFGQVWFLFYSGAPVVLSSFWLDYMVRRIVTLNRANARLMRTAFSAVIRVDGISDDCKVSETNEDFDELVKSRAIGRRSTDLFRTTDKDVALLCSPSLNNDRKVRRLRTVIACHGYQQDVELRVLSSTEDELHTEKGLTLGVAVLGEPAPIVNEVVRASVLVEQELNSLPATLRPAPIPEDEVIEDLTEFDSISKAGLRNRQRRAKSNRGTKSSCSSISNSSGITEPERPSNLPDNLTPKSSAYGSWKSSDESEAYLKECSMSHLEDLLSAWNFAHNGCCGWHSAAERLCQYANELRCWKTCRITWPQAIPIWQCKSCSALQFQDEECCWLCYDSQ